MIVEVTLLDETFATVGDVASVRPLSGVYQLVLCQRRLGDTSQVAGLTNERKDGK